MSFKQITHTLATAGVEETIYTVPTGKEYVLFRTRARDMGEAVVTFKRNSTIFSTLTIPQMYSGYGVAKSNCMKDVLTAGTVIKASSTVASTFAEVFGLELPAGTWATVGTNPRTA